MSVSVYERTCVLMHVEWNMLQNDPKQRVRFAGAFKFFFLSVCECVRTFMFVYQNMLEIAQKSCKAVCVELAGRILEARGKSRSTMFAQRVRRSSQTAHIRFSLTLQIFPETSNATESGLIHFGKRNLRIYIYICMYVCVYICMYVLRVLSAHVRACGMQMLRLYAHIRTHRYIRRLCKYMYRHVIDKTKVCM